MAYGFLFDAQEMPQTRETECNYVNIQFNSEHNEINEQNG